MIKGGGGGKRKRDIKIEHIVSAISYKTKTIWVDWSVHWW